jgi:hypothetical protein
MLFTTHYVGDRTKKEDMDGAYGTHRRYQHVVFWWENLKQRGYLKVLYMDEYDFKMCLKQYYRENMDSIYLADDMYKWQTCVKMVINLWIM